MSLRAANRRHPIEFGIGHGIAALHPIRSSCKQKAMLKDFYPAVIILIVGALAFGWNSVGTAGGLLVLLLICSAAVMGGMMIMKKNHGRPSTKQHTEADRDP